MPSGNIYIYLADGCVYLALPISHCWYKNECTSAWQLKARNVVTFAWQLTVAAGRHDERLTGRMSGADEREARSVALEKAYVHEVYEQISGTQLPAGASADSQRGRAWPKVKQFLSELEPGSLVCDVGKWYLPSNALYFTRILVVTHIT